MKEKEEKEKKKGNILPAVIITIIILFHRTNKLHTHAGTAKAFCYIHYQKQKEAQYNIPTSSFPVH
jgi:hypothetical protein